MVNMIFICLGGFPDPKGMKKEMMADWLSEICKMLFDRSIFPMEPNHVLINQYQGDEGIHAHKDGPLYYPRVAIASLGGSALMSFRSKLSQPTSELELILLPRSLLIFTDQCYFDMFHEIPVSLTDVVSKKCANSAVISAEPGQVFLRSMRVSLTMRIVPRVKIPLKS